MVSMNQMRDLIDEDDFSEFFVDTPAQAPQQVQQPSSSMSQQPEVTKPAYQKETGKTDNMSHTSNDDPSSPRDEDIMKKLKEVDAFMGSYSGVSMPREQIWKNSELLSMDKLLEFDENQEEEKVLEPEPPKPAEPVFQKNHRPVQNGFNASEALGLLLNIQRSSEDTKFDLIDGFLDKYKIEKKSKKSPNFEDLTAPRTTASSRMTANQIFENIVQSNSNNKVAPFCVQSRGPNPEPTKRVELTPSYSTFEAIQNVEVCQPTSVPKANLDDMISSNRNEKSKDSLYWERRRINNEAAHRSRAKRKRLIEEKAERIQYYEQENPKLKQKLEVVLNECAGLKRKLAFYEKYEFK